MAVDAIIHTHHSPWFRHGLLPAIARFAPNPATGFNKAMGTKSREAIYGGSIRAAAERATEARKEPDRLAVDAWNKRMRASDDVVCVLG
jgi:hypothetical protein